MALDVASDELAHRGDALARLGAVLPQEAVLGAGEVHALDAPARPLPRLHERIRNLGRNVVVLLGLAEPGGRQGTRLRASTMRVTLAPLIASSVPK